MRDGLSWLFLVIYPRSVNTGDRLSQSLEPFAKLLSPFTCDRQVHNIVFRDRSSLLKIYVRHLPAIGKYAILSFAAVRAFGSQLRS